MLEKPTFKWEDETAKPRHHFSPCLCVTEPVTEIVQMFSFWCEFGVLQKACFLQPLSWNVKNQSFQLILKVGGGGMPRSFTFYATSFE